MLVPMSASGTKRVPLRWILLAPLLFVAACVAVANGPADIRSYRLADDRTLVLNLETNPVVWVGVTGVEERADSVVISTREFDLVGLPSCCGQIHEATVHLRDPLRDRQVIDAASGMKVPLLQ